MAKKDKEDIDALPEDAIDMLSQISVQGQSLTDEKIWRDRIAKLLNDLPQDFMAPMLKRLQDTNIGRMPKIAGFAKAYALTPAETKLVRSLCAGHNVPEHSRRENISPNTGRVHMQRVLDKTGASGQLDLIRRVHSFG